MFSGELLLMSNPNQLPKLTDSVAGHVRASAGTSPASAPDRKFWFGLSDAVMEQLADRWEATTKAYNATRQ